MDIVELHAIVHGRVQGVGFRGTVCHHGTRLGLKGSVCNLPDGCVEIYAQGPQHLLEQLLTNIQNDAGLGFVESISKDYYPPKHSFEHFSIIYSRASRQS